MATDLDLTQPGPAGMWFDPNILTPEAQARDQAARDAHETYCDSCGKPRAGNGYGNRTHRGKPVGRSFVACDDPDCKVACRAASEDPRVADALMAKRKGRAA